MCVVCVTYCITYKPTKHQQDTNRLQCFKPKLVICGQGLRSKTLHRKLPGGPRHAQTKEETPLTSPHSTLLIVLVSSNIYLLMMGTPVSLSVKVFGQQESVLTLTDLAPDSSMAEVAAQVGRRR